jgi:hypothetical protein
MRLPSGARSTFFERLTAPASFVSDHSTTSARTFTVFVFTGDVISRCRSTFDSIRAVVVVRDGVDFAQTRLEIGLQTKGRPKTPDTRKYVLRCIKTLLLLYRDNGSGLCTQSVVCRNNRLIAIRERRWQDNIKLDGLHPENETRS